MPKMGQIGPSDVEALIAVHAAIAAAHHARYTNGEADARIALHAVDVDAHHDKVHGAAQHTNRTRTIEIPAGGGWVPIGTFGLDIMPGWWGDSNADAPVASFLFKVPDGFVSFTKIEAKWLANVAAGNMRWKLEVQYGAAGELYATHSDTPAYGQTATGGAMIQNVQEPANPLTLANLALGDNLGIRFRREGSHALDTLDVPAYILSIIFTYVADE